MSRAHLDYTQRRPTGRFAGVDVTAPVAGCYKARVRSGGVFVGVRLFYGPPVDPITGEELDRSWRWQAEANGEPVDFDDVWPACAASPITEAEYRLLIARQEWARQHAPESSFADPRHRPHPLGRGEPNLF